MGWAKRWGFLTRMRAQLETELGSAVFQEAWERGLHLSMADMMAEIERFIKRER